MTTTQQIIIAGMVLLGTMITRYLPFIVFSGSRTPDFVTYLGRFLPSAALGMLVVYCFKDVPILSGNHGVPELIAAALTVALHIWKRQMLLSIAGGGVTYMLLVQFVF